MTSGGTKDDHGDAADLLELADESTGPVGDSSAVVELLLAARKARDLEELSALRERALEAANGDSTLIWFLERRFDELKETFTNN